jgi:DNA-binding response OmpR family regulator
MASQKCVLIYDDDLEILTLCKIILKRENYHVETCKICDHIIDDIQKYKPDIILMDLWIPKIGGEEAIKLMREDPDGKDIPVLLFSANDEIKKISKSTKVNGYIQKPFDINIFKAEIEKWIEE